MSGSREAILGRVRAAIAHDAPIPPIRRTYRDHHAEPDLVDLITRNLTDYRARVYLGSADELPPLVSRLVREFGGGRLAHPVDLPAGYLPDDTAITRVVDDGTLTAADLDGLGSVVTACALAIAETGTLVLDAGPGQGRRLLTLVPDHHICVVRTRDQIVASVPQALARLDARRPQTWISGPSATSDIELSRVEGVHGPRTLDVVFLVDS